MQDDDGTEGHNDWMVLSALGAHRVAAYQRLRLAVREPLCYHLTGTAAEEQ